MTNENIAKAISEFQKDLPNIDQDGINPHFKSKYATLSNVTKKVFPKLVEHGLSFTTGSFVENGVLILDAHLLHESGESRSMQFPITETNPQKVGSAVTYYRRYALASLTGVVADEDDDGNVASKPSAAEIKLDKARQTKPAASKPVTSSRSQSPIQQKVAEWIAGDEAKKTEANRVHGLHKDSLKGEELWAKVAEELGVDV